MKRPYCTCSKEYIDQRLSSALKQFERNFANTVFNRRIGPTDRRIVRAGRRVSNTELWIHFKGTFKKAGLYYRGGAKPAIDRRGSGNGRRIHLLTRRKS